MPSIPSGVPGHTRVLGKNKQETPSIHSENCGLEASRDNRLFPIFNPKPQAVDFTIETRRVIHATHKARKIISYGHDARRMQGMLIS